MTLAIVSPQARIDALTAAAWIAKDNPDAALRFLDVLENAARQIGAHPNIGSAKPHVTDRAVRFLVLPGYPYLIVYDPARKPPLIVRILHGARDIPALLQDL